MNLPSSASSERSHVYFYDWVRLLGTIFVIIGHATYTVEAMTHGSLVCTMPSDASGAAMFLFKLARHSSDWMYTFHMPLFFMLSGAMMAIKPMPRFDRFVASRVKRLLIPFFVYGLGFMIPIKLLTGYYNKSALKEAIFAFPSGEHTGHLWFLLSLFATVVVFASIYKLLSRKTDSLFVLLIVCGVVPVLGRYLDSHSLYSGYLAYAWRYLFWVAFGFAFEKLRQQRQPWGKAPLFLALGVTFLLEIPIFLKKGAFGKDIMILIGAMFTYALARLLDMGSRKLYASKVWKMLIRNLFYVYLFHNPLNYVVLRLFMPGTALGTAWGYILYTFLRTVGVFAVSVLLGELVRLLKAAAGRWLQPKTAAAP